MAKRRPPTPAAGTFACAREASRVVAVSPLPGGRREVERWRVLMVEILVARSSPLEGLGHQKNLIAWIQKRPDWSGAETASSPPSFWA